METVKTVVTGIKQQATETSKTNVNIPRRIRNAGKIISKHDFDAHEEQHAKHADKYDTVNTHDNSVPKHVLKNPNLERKIKVDKTYKLSSELIPMIGIPASIVNQSISPNTSPI